MSTDKTIELLGAVTKLLSVLVWPSVVVFVLIRFGEALRKFIGRSGEVSFKGAGLEVSVKQKAEIAAAIGAADASRRGAGAEPGATVADARSVAGFVARITPSEIQRAGGSRVLWVDDQPDNNVYERQALEALGVKFVLATSTDEAIGRLEHQSFDAIISDMDRPPDSKAGYTLLDSLRAEGKRTPLILYTSSRAPEHRAEARRRGAVDCTNRPSELLEKVLSVLG